LHLKNSIVAASPSGGDCVDFGLLTTNTNNLIEDSTCDPAVMGDPLLGPLADNGGSTETMALGFGSPAIDAGDDASCAATDQRGTTRPKDGDGDGTAYCDIGAYERDTTLITNVDAGRGGRLAYAHTPGSPTIIDIPAGAVTETTTLVYTPVDPAAPPAGFSFAGHAFTLEAYRNDALLPDFTFEEPVTVTIYYSESDVVGLDEGTLELRYWNGSAWVTDGITLVERNTVQNYVVFTIAHLSEFALIGETFAQPPASVEKLVTPIGAVNYGDELTYTLVISAAPGTQLGLFDPLENTTFVDFVEQPEGVTHVDTIDGTVYLGGVITGSLTVTPTNQVTVSFVVEVGIPGTADLMLSVTNEACVYLLGGTLGYCIWSNEVTNETSWPYGVFLPLVLRNN
jgi:hypothetical protein